MKKQYREDKVNVCVLLPLETYNLLVERADRWHMTLQDTLTYVLDILLAPKSSTDETGNDHAEDDGNG
jgi:hypothetical protein